MMVRARCSPYSSGSLPKIAMRLTIRSTSVAAAFDRCRSLRSSRHALVAVPFSMRGTTHVHPPRRFASRVRNWSINTCCACEPGALADTSENTPIDSSGSI